MEYYIDPVEVTDPWFDLEDGPKLLFPWSDLEDLEGGLVEMIMAHVTSPFDLLRCRGVCRSWRSAAVKVLSGGISNGAQKNIRHTAPLLLLFSSKTSIALKDHRKLVCLVKNTATEHRYYGAPDIERTTCYLAPEPEPEDVDDKDINKEAKRSRRNKRTSCYLSEPEDVNDDKDNYSEEKKSKRVYLHRKSRCIASYRGWLLLHSNVDRYLFNPISGMVVRLPPLPPGPPNMNDANQLRFIASSSGPGDPTCMVYLYTTVSCLLAVYRVGDREWKPVCAAAKHRWVSVILYKGRFYSVDKFGVLRRFGFEEDGSDHKEEVVSSTTTVCSSRYRYLVESWSGELLMVVRRLVCCTKLVNKTSDFEIFKLNWSNGEWEEMGDFGDQALFLCRNDSKFVQVIHKSEYRNNSIYFIDDLGRDAKSGHVDYGVYDLGKRKVEPLNLPHNKNLQCQWFQLVL